MENTCLGPWTIPLLKKRVLSNDGQYFTNVLHSGYEHVSRERRWV